MKIVSTVSMQFQSYVRCSIFRTSAISRVLDLQYQQYVYHLKANSISFEMTVQFDCKIPSSFRLWDPPLLSTLKNMNYIPWYIYGFGQKTI